MILHGNGPKITLNALANYLSKSWNLEEGCRHCKLGQINLSELKPSEMPTVVMAVFIEQGTPFFEEQLEKLYKLEYPKQKIHLFLHNNVSFFAFYILSYKFYVI